MRLWLAALAALALLPAGTARAEASPKPPALSAREWILLDAGDQRQAYAIDERMKQLGRSERYLKELARISRGNDLPPEWATAEQRSRAALKAIGR